MAYGSFASHFFAYEFSRYFNMLLAVHHAGCLFPPSNALHLAQKRLLGFALRDLNLFLRNGFSCGVCL